MTKSELVYSYYLKYPSATTKDCSINTGVSKRHVRRIKKGFGYYNWKEKKEEKKNPKVLVFDIETSPITCYTWGLYKQNISPDNVIKDWAILSWSAKWLFDSEIMSEVVTPEEAMNRTEGSIIKGIWKLLDEASVVLAHNGKNFDVRKLNAKFLLHGLKPPMPYQIIDTYQESKKNFAFTSNKLDYILKMLGLSQKIHTDFSLWKRCVAGDSEALEEMVTYNRQDVLALEEFYVLLRPWIKCHPNMSLFMDLDSDVSVCTNCGSNDLTERGFYTTTVNKYKAFRCNSCGAICRSRFSEINKKLNENILVSVAH